MPPSQARNKVHFCSAPSQEANGGRIRGRLFRIQEAGILNANCWGRREEASPSGSDRVQGSRQGSFPASLGDAREEACNLLHATRVLSYDGTWEAAPPPSPPSSVATTLPSSSFPGLQLRVSLGPRPHPRGGSAVRSPLPASPIPLRHSGRKVPSHGWSNPSSHDPVNPLPTPPPFPGLTPEQTSV